MNFEEFAAKPRLAEVGIPVPHGILASDPATAKEAAEEIGCAVIKAQVPVGKRGKAGGIQIADTAEAAESHARNILGMDIGGYRVDRVLVEEKSDIRAEYYAAVLNDPVSKGPMIIFSTEGGMDIEEIAAETPGKLKQQAIDIRYGFSRVQADTLIGGLDLLGANGAVADVLCKLYLAYAANDAELLEINPLIVTADGSVVALDCKFVMDDSAVKRHPGLAKNGASENLTELELQGEAAGIKYIELQGDVGVLANGAGLTMTTMDVIRHHGGEPANFCEIGGEAYTKAKTALELVLAKPGIKSLVVNFCGAFARCDVMMEGLLNAWEELNPTLPVFFSIAGTGDEEAIKMLKVKLDMSPMPDMSDACEKAVHAARAAG
jgi:succinyl-CoA synthetase beta subunit